ncbi:PREDICTED: 4-coumarate--CoA ligase 1-like isoform X2 [Dinoponera quadriceps]|uniref:4-coumarate--CoA ligase 1-like isoform X2 n=1 Tax=Dinoponera quadriceps TaxID=609295 RepID=A0A6P3YBX8_DINQU|nr:PREDICTED: 4-coumarate--CoA ligase 1-like isoform X2 [Dinoponera quadriceps]
MVSLKLEIDGCNNDYRLTYRDLLEKSVKLAKFMQRYGIKIGDRIAIVSENRLEWLIALCATLYIGAIFAPYNPTYTEWEFRHVLNISEPRIVFVSQRTEETFTKLQPSLSWQIELIELDDKPFAANMRTLTNILNDEKVADFLKYKTVNIGDIKKHPAVLLNSSGTTGLPKAVALSHRNLLTLLLKVSKRDFLDITQDTRSLIFLPFYHGFAFATLLISLTVGANVMVMSNFQPERFLKLVQKYKPTFLPIVPSIMTLLAKHPLVERNDFRSLREILCGGSPLGKELVDAVKARIGDIYIRNGYGMTELTVLTSVSAYEESDVTALHCIVPGLCSKIVDIETQKTLDVDQVGEVCFKGDQIMMMYWNNPEATKQTIDEDGWLHTGDLGYYNEHGAMYVVDRLKELIKYNGYQVSPSEIEMVLLSHPAVRDATVCGRPDPRSGELPTAVIVKQPGATVTAENIMEFVKQKLSPHKWLRGGVQFVDAIPKNATGKSLRREVQLMIQATVSKL